MYRQSSGMVHSLRTNDLLCSIISSNFPISFKNFGIFQIITKILLMLAITDVSVKTAKSYSWIESAIVNRNISVDTRKSIGGNKYSSVFKRNARRGFGCDGKKPIVWHNFWIHWNNFNLSVINNCDIGEL